MKKLVVRKMFTRAAILILFICAIFFASCKNAVEGDIGSSHSGSSSGSAGNIPELSGNGGRLDDIIPSQDAPKEMKPEKMEEKQVDEYANIENDHKTDIVFADDLEGTEWSCAVEGFHQYLIFNDIGGFIAVFYGSGNSKEAAKLKANESKNSFETSYDMRNDDDCNIGYVSVEGRETIKIALFPLPDGLSMPSGYKYIKGGFYMSPSGQLIARPASGSGDETDFKIGFVKEN